MKQLTLISFLLISMVGYIQKKETTFSFVRFGIYNYTIKSTKFIPVGKYGDKAPHDSLMVSYYHFSDSHWNIKTPKYKSYISNVDKFGDEKLITILEDSIRVNINLGKLPQKDFFENLKYPFYILTANEKLK